MAVYRPFTIKPELKTEEYNSNYVSYVLLPKLFTEEEVDKILALWKDESAKQGEISGGLDLTKRKATELTIKAPGNEWIYDRIANTALMINAGRFKLEVYGFGEPIRLMKYEEGDFFNWHMDYGPKTSDRKIVVCVQLSGENEYEGGDLQLNTENTSALKNKGSAAIFPSYLLHRVLPITSGSRQSMVALISGPPYR